MRFKKLPLLLLIMVFLTSLLPFGSGVQAASTITFTAEELLGKPTNNSITINIVPDSTIVYHYQYGTVSGSYPNQTANVTATGGQPSEITISGLSANTKYYYRMRYHAPGDGADDWVNRTEHSFMTQRVAGTPFTFTVTSDSHATFNAQHQNAMTNVLNETPDFHIDIGDTFYPASGSSSQTAVNNAYLAYRDPVYMDRIGHSVPIFLTPGNHEEEEGWNLDDTPFSIGVGSIQARKAYFPTPVNDGFYSGNTDILAAINEATYGDELREDYYAWTWGDALFVVIDEFQYTMNLPYTPAAGEGSDDSVTGNQWSWTLGEQQYNWLKNTLRTSNAKYKFVFSHHMLGGIPRNIVGVGAGYVRGGAEASLYFEWGGNNADGSRGFETNRPGWDITIHDLFVETGVSAYFHGHDHQYVYETRDGIVYQEVPSPSMTGSGFSGIYTEGTYSEYSTIEMLPSTGHLKVTVGTDQATVDYISSSSTSGTVNYSYDILPSNTTPSQYTITASAGANGSIDPAGAVLVDQGSSSSFNISALPGFRINDVLVDGASVGVVTSYTFNNVQADRSISVSFDAAPSSSVTVDGAVSSGTADDVNILNITHTTGTGENRLLLVGVSWNCGTANRSISSVVFNDGTNHPLTEVITQLGYNTTNPRYSAIYSLANPPSGQTGTVTVNFSGSVTNGIMAGVANFAGVDQTTPLGTPSGANGNSTTASVTLTGLDGDELVFDNVFRGASSTDHTLTVGTNQTQLWNPTYIANLRSAASTEQATSSSVTMSWALATGNYWAIAAVPINPAAGSGTTYSLTMAVSGSGTTSPAVGTYTYNENTVVNITATPTAGNHFVNWTGEVANVNSASTTVTMNSNKTVTAIFAADATPITFTGTEFLGRPEDTSITVSVVPDAAILLHYDYGTATGDYSGSTANVPASAGQPTVVNITGLTANTKYYYRMEYSTDGGTSWIPRSENTFYTQRAAGSTFTFDITTDSHIDIMLGNESNWTSTLNGIAAEDPDFLIDLGDTVAMDNGSTSVALGDTAAAEQKYKDTLPYFNMVSDSVPLYMLAGNHEQQEAWHLQGTLANSLPVMSKNAEKKFFLNPGNDAFYSGDASTLAELSGDHMKQDYYAWTWGDALFVVISPYWTTTTKPYTTSTGGGETDATGSGDRWDWTLGLDQYTWLKNTLQGSSAKYKFIFAHQIVGGNSMTNQVNYGHGGVDSADFVEWGGYNVDGSTWAWDTERPGWGTQPVRQMLETSGVTAFFHGHDHQCAYEIYNGIVYQAVPSGSFTGSFLNYTTGNNDGKTIWADSTQGPGHLKVTVSPSQATVDFIRYNASSAAYTYIMAPTGGTSYDLTISVNPADAGTMTPAAGTHPYVEGSLVDITAIPASGYAFDHWSGELTGSTNPGQITMDGNKSITAHFVAAAGVTLDGAVSSGTGAASASSVTFSHTTGTGDNRLLLVGVSWNCGSTDRTISSVTFTPASSSALPLSLVKTQKAGTNLRYSAIYSLLNPPSGVSGTITVTFSGTVSNGIVAGAVNFAGVNQTSPLGMATGANGGASSGDPSLPSVTLTGLTGDELIFDNVFQGGTETQTLTPGAGQAQQWNAFVSNTRAAASTEQATSSSVTMSWTAASYGYWAIAAVPINPAPIQKTSVISDFDGDGKTDISVFRPSTGTWFVINSHDSSQFVLGGWGMTGDVPVAGDFDGDGKNDIAVFRPSTGTWFIINSLDSSQFVLGGWGMTGDVPVAGDFDGDGKNDIAVFRPSTGTWFIINSLDSSQYVLGGWGMTGDVPVTGDFDGDGKNDIAVFRPSTGTWFIINSLDSSQYVLGSWGMTGDVPVTGDFDGDGKNDIAVFRPSTGTWFIINSLDSSQYVLGGWGMTGDIPVTGDFDNDGKTDIAVFRPSTGTWFIINSLDSSQYVLGGWGISEDIPLP